VEGHEVVELIVTAIVGMIVLSIVAVLVAGLSFLFWVVFLPFRLLGWVFKGLGLLLLLPVLLLVGGVAMLVFGVGAFGLLLPLAPFVLLGFLLWRLVRGRSSARAFA
jgi:hypothetical protein